MDGRDRENILEDLSSEDAEVRRLAVERLPALGLETALPRIAECLGDPSWRVRKAAVDRLVDGAQSERVTALLVGALADGENPGRRNAALEALTRCGSAAVPALVEASRNPDADVRKQGVDALAGIGDGRAAERLVAMLEDEEPNVRAAAADALGGLESAPAAQALLRTACEDAERLVRLSALRALARLDVVVAPDRLGDALEDPLLRTAAFILLGRSEAPGAAETLLKGLGSESRASREAAMEGLLHAVGRATPEEAERLAARVRSAARALPGFVPDALERLRTASLATQLVLLRFLGLLGRPECVVPVLEAGRDEALAEVALAALEGCGEPAEAELDAAWSRLDPEVRILACALLGRTRGAVGAARLRAALAEPDPALRVAAAGALRRRADAGALAELVDRLEAASAGAESEEAREEIEALVEAIVAIGAAGGEDAGAAAELLTARLGAAGPSFRAAALEVLGRIGRPEDAEGVADLLSDPAPEVRRTAVSALARLAPGGVPEALRLALADESASVRIAAARALAASGDPSALADLAHLARGEDERVRAAALRGVGVCLESARSGGGEGVRSEGLRLLEQALAGDGPVALAALEALGRVGGGAAARAAASALGSPDPELAKAAVECVGRHGPAELLPELVSALGHPHWAVRAEAVQALADRGVERAVPALLRRIEVEEDDFVRAALLGALERLES